MKATKGGGCSGGARGRTAPRIRAAALTRVAATLAAGLASAACGEREAAAPVPPAVPVAASVGALDASINPNDSWATASIEVRSSTVITMDTAVVDPFTLQQTTTVNAEPPAEVVDFQTGFTTSGQVVAVTADPDVASLETRDVETMRQVDGTVYDLTPTGALIGDTPEETQSGTDPITQVPVPQGTQLVDALVLPPDAGGGTGGGGGGGGGGDSCLTTCDNMLTRGLGSGAGALRVVARTSHELVLESALPARVADGTPHGHVRRRYEKIADRWTVAEIETEREDADERGHRVLHRQNLHFRNVRYHEDKEKNKARRKAAREAGDPATPTYLVPARGPQRMIACDVDCGGGSSGSGTGTPPAPPPPTDCEYVVPGVRGDGLPGIVLQHGIWSNACTWTRMMPWIDNTFAFGGHLKISLPSTATYDDQRDSLRRALDRIGEDSYIFIGHSNGGIVSRRLAQQISQESPGKVQGVITIDSPHHGGPAMRLGIAIGAAALGTALALPQIYLCAGNQRGCGEVQMIMSAEGPLWKLASLATTPLYYQMVPNSGFQTTQLNATAEPFKKVGIVSRSQKKFVWARLWSELACAPDDWCGGREQVHRTKRLVSHLKHVAILSALVSVGALIVGQTSTAYQAAVAAVKSGGLLVTIEVFDWLYRQVVSPGDDSDGIAPVQSQTYPNADRLYYIENADSHVGATRSEYVRDRVFAALSAPELFGRPRR